MKILRYSLIGLLISLSTTFIFTTFTIYERHISITANELMNNLVIAIGLGISIGMMSMIFESDRFPFVFQLLMHYVFVITVVFIAGTYGNWFDTSKKVDYLSLLGNTSIIYVIIWCIVYVLMKKDVKQLNEAIKNRKGE